MSYILDALRKSEEERQRGAVPDIRSVHDAAPEKPRKYHSRRYLIILALLLNAGLIAFWIAPWQSKVMKTSNEAGRDSSQPQKQSTPTAPPVEPSAVERKDTVLSERAPVLLQNSAPSTERRNPVVGMESGSAAKVAEPVRPGAQQHHAVSASTLPPKQGSPSGDIKPASQKRLSQPSAQSESKADREHPADPAKRLLNLSDLPPSLREELPEFSVSVFLYSPDPESRMIRVNGKTLREGQELVAGLRLEEITEDAAVFSHETRRFTLKLQ